jgi:hypothetical protein
MGGPHDQRLDRHTRVEGGEPASYIAVTPFGVLGGSIPAGWLIVGVLFLALALRFASVIFMEGMPMITRSTTRVAKTHKPKNTNLNPVTNVMKLCSVSFETVWALIVGWSAGMAGPAPSARLRQRCQ